ncbi:uncharacterized protein GGS25DRAFT_207331 [Hypoxylon fragiforme]|uniref:uncharacterized protein n=1 Tax=Hypoxylon fragiforme TaxID=63214 RepID=UPI0020C6C58C|nr:uncharacterized protein GGS25DRAFT_207331 [Hypoxylon fragiforme]KAI2611727.1 hypothetical protein GGS25DRAFT_207331 [Hypoxylon fragiforme]
MQRVNRRTSCCLITRPSRCSSLPFAFLERRKTPKLSPSTPFAPRRTRSTKMTLPATYTGLQFSSASPPGTVLVRPLYAIVVQYANQIFANGNPRGHRYPLSPSYQAAPASRGWQPFPSMLRGLRRAS